ncbi:MAG: endonuclease/exonuclease/phosphatase family protein [Bacteroidia bacterium]|nr:endonuclease/exonuclease/phosphatase family protein [Bacteroidia bacterium]
MKRKYLVILGIAIILVLGNFTKWLFRNQNKTHNFSDTIQKNKIKKHKKFKTQDSLKIQADDTTTNKKIDNPHGPTNSKENIRLMSWNIQNFGKSKDANEIKYITKTLKDMDIVAIQEVSSTFVGPQAVAKLADELNRTGNKWLYAVSDPTTGTGTERYAYLWKPSRVRLIGEPFLEKSLADEIDREPYLARFECKGERVLLVNFHAVPQSKHPEREIELLPRIQSKYANEKIVMMGDFNLSQKSPAFEGMRKRGLKPALINVKTSLRMRSNSTAPADYFSEEYDNFYFNPTQIDARTSQRIDFVRDFRSLEDARKISDHVPIVLEFVPRTQRRENFQR